MTGGGLNQPPLENSAADRAIAAKICTYVTYGVLYLTVKKKLKIFVLLINYANLCMKSLFGSKVENKVPRILIFGVNILCSILINVLEKKMRYHN